MRTLHDKNEGSYASETIKETVKIWNLYNFEPRFKVCDDYPFTDFEQIRVITELMEKEPDLDGWHVEFQDNPENIFHQRYDEDLDLISAFISMYGHIQVRHPSLSRHVSCDDESVMIISGEKYPVSSGKTGIMNPYIVLGTLQEVWGFHP
jgi:hypothetical protein